MDHKSDATRYRDQAGKFRTKARLMGDDEIKARYEGIASAYDALAQSEEALAQKLVQGK